MDLHVASLQADLLLQLALGCVEGIPKGDVTRPRVLPVDDHLALARHVHVELHLEVPAW